MLTIGLTGGIGSGKTAVSDLFESFGVPVIDTDIIARQLTTNEPKILQKISDTFGEHVLNIDGTLNRKKLAQIVFNVAQNKQKLENILHPKIEAEVLKQLNALSCRKLSPIYAIVVIPLLLETNAYRFTERTLVVMAEESERINRVQQRDNRSLSEINAIIADQTNDEERIKKADDIIRNNHGLKDLAKQVQGLHAKYQDLAKGWMI